MGHQVVSFVTHPAPVTHNEGDKSLRKVQMKIEDLAEHVRTIGYAFKIEVKERECSYEDSHATESFEVNPKTGKAMFDRSLGRELHVRYISSEFGYAVAMHELGHLLHPTGLVHVRDERNLNYALIMLEEESAYEWAHANSPIWTPEMQRAEELGMNTYREGMIIAKLKAKVAARKSAHPRESIKDFLKRSRI